MSSSVCDSVLDFDLNLLNPSSNKTGENSTARRKAIYMVKKKTIATDSLIRAFYAKKDALAQAEKDLQFAKEECKQICIEYKKSQEACAQLEKKLQLLTTNDKGHESKYVDLKNQVAAAKSHVVQLQTLVKDKETLIEALKIENQLSKCSNVKDKDSDKKTLQSLQRECDMLRKHMNLAKDIIFGKTKINARHRLLLKKYDKYEVQSKDDSLFGEEESNEEYAFDEIALSPFSEDYVDEAEMLKTNKLQNGYTKRKDFSTLEQTRASTNSLTECNDLVSIDTGRGSSRAFSGSDKCFLSPDYFNDDNLLNDDPTLDKIQTKFVDSATSPINNFEAINAGTSPVCNTSYRDVAVSTDYHSMNDQALSPINGINEIPHKNTNIDNRKCDVNCVFLMGLKKRNVFNNKEHEHNTIDSEEKRLVEECLELNNSENICNESSHDNEIEKILSTMKLHHKLITPIPVTPAKPSTESGTNVYQTPIKHQEREIESHHPKDKECDSNGQLRERVSKLEDSVCELKRVINYINKSLNLPGINELSEVLHSNEVVDMIISNDEVVVPRTDNLMINDENKCIHDSSKINNNNNKQETFTNNKVLAINEENHHSKITYNNHSIVNNKTNGDIEKLSGEQYIGMEDDVGSKMICDHELIITKDINIEIKQPHVIDVPNDITNNNTLLAGKYDQGLLSENDLLATVNETVVPTSNKPLTSDKTHKDIASHGTHIEPLNNRVVVLDDKIVNQTSTPISSLIKQTDVCKSNKNEIKINKLSSKQKKISSLFSVAARSPVCKTQEDSIEHVWEIKENDINLSILECEGLTANVDNNSDLTDEIAENEKNTVLPASEMSEDCHSPNKVQESKLVKIKKLTKLDRFKQKLLPKYKIKREDLSLKRNIKLTEIVNPNKKKTVTEADSCATLNNKDAYEKAVKVISELKRKSNIPSNSNEPEHSINISKKPSYPGDIQCIEENKCKESDCTLSNGVTSSQLNTRSRSKVITQATIDDSNIISPQKSPSKGMNIVEMNVDTNLTKSKTPLKRVSQDTSIEIPYKRILRSYTTDYSLGKEPKVILRRCEQPLVFNLQSNNAYENVKNNSTENVLHSIKDKGSPCKRNRDTVDKHSQEVNINTSEHEESIVNKSITDNPRESVLCQMIQRYGVKVVKYNSTKISDSLATSISKKIEDNISRIKELPAQETKNAMNKFVADILVWEIKPFLAGLMKYLKDPERKIEMHCKVVVPSAPALTKGEQILIYVFSELKVRMHWVDVVDKILSCMEYTLFALNRTPPFDVIESMSHFYAVICRYFRMKTRLRLFILDAMYCIQFKAVPLIRQCIEVWMHILPIAHMASAKSPLVTCLVYLLHFYKCEDRLNRIQDIRNILSRKYFYTITEWNENKILELFRNSITSLRGIPTEDKMLRIALIILAKRHGPRWCQNNIVKNVLQPIIEKKDSADKVKAFCISMLGPLLKPFPADMKVHCEIVMNQLITMLQENPSPKIAEAIVMSLIYLNRHNQMRVIQALILWRPRKLSTELETILKDFVKSKPLKMWKTNLSKALQ